MHTAKEFKEDLSRLGVRAGDTLMIHCSYKALGGIEGGAAAVFAAIEELLGAEGTLIMPAFSYDTVTYETPVFDVQNTPSCIGYLPEYFRTQESGVVRSLHATHSCCAKGKRAAEFVADHELDATPVGPHSPIAKLAEADGKILILGSHPDHNTALHGVEEKAGAPYVLNREKQVTYQLITANGTIERPSYRHYFHREGYSFAQCYARIIGLLSETECAHGNVLEAESYLMSSKAVWEKGVQKIKEDPYYFVERVKR